MKRGYLICFMGIDGSGKSTLARILERHLTTQGVNCRYLWWLEAEDSMLRKALRKMSFELSERHTDETQARRPNGFRASLYQDMVLLGYLKQLVLRVWIPIRHGRTVICDRYLFDTIVAFAIEFGYSKKRYERMFNLVRKLAPSPDVFFLVDIPPEVAINRKSDITSAESLVRPRAMYLEMARCMNAVMIDGTRDLEYLTNEVLRKVRTSMEKSNE